MPAWLGMQRVASTTLTACELHSLIRSRTSPAGFTGYRALCDWVVGHWHCRLQPSGHFRPHATAAGQQVGHQQQLRPQTADEPVALQADGRKASSKSVLAKQLARVHLLGPPRVLEDDVHLIKDSHISKHAWEVMGDLQRAGHQVYVVGGTLRDIMLQGTPKDLDILTTAEPNQIKKLFRRCLIVGRHFPVAHVRIGNSLLEVSSFATSVQKDYAPAEAAAAVAWLKSGGKSSNEGMTWSTARRCNALARDFTVNALLYDPFARILYDYAGGVADIERRQLRCIGDPRTSFQQDPARMLRAVRLAARAGLRIESNAAAAIKELGPLILNLPAGRLQMELGGMMAHGAAASSMQLLWRYDLLDLLLPVHAAYLRDKGFPRQVKRQRSDLLFDMLEHMDQHIQPHNPVGPLVWIAMLAAPLVIDAQQHLATASPARKRGRPRKRPTAQSAWMDVLQTSTSGTDAARKLATQPNDDMSSPEGSEAALTRSVVDALLQPQACGRPLPEPEQMLTTLLPKGPANQAVKCIQEWLRAVQDPWQVTSLDPTGASTDAEEEVAQPTPRSRQERRAMAHRNKRQPLKDKDILWATLTACWPRS